MGHLGSGVARLEENGNRVGFRRGVAASCEAHRLSEERGKLTEKEGSSHWNSAQQKRFLARKGRRLIRGGGSNLVG